MFPMLDKGVQRKNKPLFYPLRLNRITFPKEFSKKMKNIVYFNVICSSSNKMNKGNKWQTVNYILIRQIFKFFF